MVTGVALETVVVLIVKYGEAVCPAVTVTLAGTGATAGLELLNATVRSAAAGPSRVTRLDAVLPPPPTELGEAETEYNPTGRTVRTPALVTPP